MENTVIISCRFNTPRMILYYQVLVHEEESTDANNNLTHVCFLL